MTDTEQDAPTPVTSMIEAKPAGDDGGDDDPRKMGALPEAPPGESAPGPEPDAEPEASAEDDPPPAREAEEVLADLPLELRVEALLFAADRPTGEARLAALLGLPAKGAAARVREAIEKLNEHYEATGRSFRARKIASGWQLYTESEFGPLLLRMHADRQQARLSQAALETLSIIAYRQPIMRAEIEAIRGVACGEVLRGLLERRLVKIVGRAEELGRPMLYGTTKQFLQVFGLAGLDDLPPVESGK